MTSIDWKEHLSHLSISNYQNTYNLIKIDPMQEIAPYSVVIADHNALSRCHQLPCEGYASLVAIPNNNARNVFGQCHGWVLCNWADALMAATANHLLHSFGYSCFTRSITYEYYGMIPIGQTVHMVSSIRTVDKYVHVLCIVISNDLVVGKAQGKFYIVNSDIAMEYVSKL